jgi:preprotein translocase subunit SecD
MLSLLLTAVLVLGALVAALHFRSAWRAVAVAGLAAAGLVLFAQRTLDGLATPRMHFVYEIDEPHAIAPGPDLAGRTGAAVQSRLDRLGLHGPVVRVEGDTLDLLVPATSEDELRRVQDTLAAVGLLEFAAVADDSDFFASFEADPEVIKRGIRILQENAPIGPGRTAIRRYAFLPRGENEGIGDTRRRLNAWTATLPVPDGLRLAVEKQVEYDAEMNTWEDTGWRTFVLEREPLLTGRDIAAARAQPDMSDASLGGWQVALELTGEGGILFEEATGRLIKRRFAIVVDGIVASAPVVQTRIGGGRGVITMGQGTPENQARTATSLAAVLSSGSLPAPLILAKMDRVEAPLAPSILGALTAAAGLLLAAGMVFALWLGFRAPRAATARLVTSEGRS